MIPNETLKTRLLENPEVKAEYDKLEPVYELVRELVRARARAEQKQAREELKKPERQQRVQRRNIVDVGDQIEARRDELIKKT